MNRKYLCFLSGFVMALLTSFTANAQSKFTTKEKVELLQKIDKSLAGIKTVVYKINYDNKYLSNRDTVRTVAVCSLYLKPTDKMKAYNMVDLEYVNSGSQTYGHRRYDGKKTFWMNYPVDSLDVYKEPYIDDDKRITKSIVQNYRSLLLTNFLMTKKPFRSYKSGVEVISVTEEVYNNEPVYVLLWGIEEPDEECGTLTGFKKHIIRKSDYLPVAYTYILKCENMLQYESAEIEYLNINPDIPLENFKVDKDEAIKPVQRYNEFKKKVNIED